MVEEVTALLQREVAAHVGPDSTFEERREVGARAAIRSSSPENTECFLAPRRASWIDQLDENALLGRPDLEVEVSEEIHPE